MVKTERTGAGPVATSDGAGVVSSTGRVWEGAEVGYGAVAVPFWYGVGIAEATVAVEETAATGKEVMLTTVERAGQLVTVAAQEVMVTSSVEYTISGVASADTTGVASADTTGKVEVLTTVERAGQSVTVAAQEMMVTSLVEYTVDSAMAAVAMTAMAAAEAIVNCILKI